MGFGFGCLLSCENSLLVTKNLNPCLFNFILYIALEFLFTVFYDFSLSNCLEMNWVSENLCACCVFLLVFSVLVGDKGFCY